MRKFLLLKLALLFSVISFAQKMPSTQFVGTVLTTVVTRGVDQADSGYVIPLYNDTTTANHSFISHYPGGEIRTIDNRLWMRSNDLSTWVQQGGNTIYTGDGTILSNRDVLIPTNTYLKFNNSTNTILNIQSDFFNSPILTIGDVNTTDSVRFVYNPSSRIYMWGNFRNSIFIRPDSNKVYIKSDTIINIGAVNIIGQLSLLGIQHDNTNDSTLLIGTNGVVKKGAPVNIGNITLYAGYGLIKKPDSVTLIVDSSLIETKYAYKNIADTSLNKTYLNSNYFVTPDYYQLLNPSLSDSAAVQTACNSGLPVMLIRIYNVNNINISSGANIYGLNDTTTGFYNNKNIPTLNLNGSNIILNNFICKADSAGSNQKCISIDGTTGTRKNIVIDNLNFSRANIGVYGKNSGSNANLGSLRLINCLFDSCSIGVFCDTIFEYNHFTANTFSSCGTGVLIRAGNNKVVGGQIVNCTNGAIIASGSNDGHSEFVGVTINACTNAIDCEGLTVGYLFTDCLIMGSLANNITINNSTNVKIKNCDYYSASAVTGTITVNNSTNTELGFHFQKGGLGQTPTLSINSPVAWVGTDWTLGVPSGLNDAGLSNGSFAINNYINTASQSSTLNLFTANNTNSSVRNIIQSTLYGGTSTISPTGAPTTGVGTNILSIIPRVYDGSAIQSKNSMDWIQDAAISSGVAPIAWTVSSSATSAARAERIRLSSIGTFSVAGGTTPKCSIDSSGNITKIRSLTSSFPSSQGTDSSILQHSSTGSYTFNPKLLLSTGLSSSSVGTATLVGGTVTVNTTVVTTASKIFLTDATTGSLTNIGTPTIGTITNGVSFVINSSNILDTSNINWLIIN